MQVWTALGNWPSVQAHVSSRVQPSPTRGCKQMQLFNATAFIQVDTHHACTSAYHATNVRCYAAPCRGQKQACEHPAQLCAYIHADRPTGCCSGLPPGLCSPKVDAHWQQQGHAHPPQLLEKVVLAAMPVSAAPMTVRSTASMVVTSEGELVQLRSSSAALPSQVLKAAACCVQMTVIF